jgi:cell wall-associated NlpC family hydrolase
MREKAFVNILVANQRAAPNHRAELINQVLFGHELNILAAENGWYLCKSHTPTYEGWIEAKEITKVTSSVADSAIPVYYQNPIGFVEKSNGEKLMVTLGVVLFSEPKTGKTVDHTGTEYKIDPSVWLPIPKQFSKENTLKYALSLLHAPYLWGGCSGFSVDCSGLVWLAFFLSGKNLPRDASQQAQVGVEFNGGTYGETALAGDLLFFAEQGKGISHVALCLGQHKYIHASGKVQVNSLNPDHADYDAFRANTWVMSRRVDA